MGSVWRAGIGPIWFDIEATGYVGASGRTHARFEVEHELLFTNRLVLQPLFEAELFGKSIPNAAWVQGSVPPTLNPSALRDQARVCAVCRYHLEQQMGETVRLRRGRRRHGRSSIRHRTAAVVLNLTTVEDTIMKRPFATVLALAVLALGSAPGSSRMRATNTRSWEP